MGKKEEIFLLHCILKIFYPNLWLAFLFSWLWFFLKKKLEIDTCHFLCCLLLAHSMIINMSLLSLSGKLPASKCVTVFRWFEPNHTTCHITRWAKKKNLQNIQEHTCKHVCTHTRPPPHPHTKHHSVCQIWWLAFSRITWWVLRPQWQGIQLFALHEMTTWRLELILNARHTFIQKWDRERSYLVFMRVCDVCLSCSLMKNWLNPNSTLTNGVIISSSCRI